MKGKVKLDIIKSHCWHPHSHATGNITYMLPYYLSNRGKYVHRIRSANTHWRDGEISHVSISFWCGNTGFMRKGKVFADIPSDGVLCAVCEGKAIGAGQDGERIINGRPVMYSPNHKD